MWGRAGALCLSASPYDSLGLDEVQRDKKKSNESAYDEDKHKAPASTLPGPLSLQNMIDSQLSENINLWIVKKLSNF